MSKVSPQSTTNYEPDKVLPNLTAVNVERRRHFSLCQLLVLPLCNYVSGRALQIKAEGFIGFRCLGYNLGHFHSNLTETLLYLCLPMAPQQQDLAVIPFSPSARARTMAVAEAGAGPTPQALIISVCGSRRDSRDVGSRLPDNSMQDFQMLSLRHTSHLTGEEGPFW
ncbi:hypothetical protein SRHO_G00113690 [Serrasalmus rhombeus]